MRRSCVLLLAAATTGCTEVLEVSVVRPSSFATISVERGQPYAPAFAPRDTTIPPAAVTPLPCDHPGGWICGKVSWTDTCVITEERALGVDALKVRQRAVGLDAAAIVAGSIASIAGSAFVGGFAKEAERHEAGGIAAVTGGALTAALGTGIDIAGVVGLTAKRRIVKRDFTPTESIERESRSGASCAGEDLADVGALLVLPEGNVRVALDSEGRFEKDLSDYLRTHAAERGKGAALMRLAFGRFARVPIGWVELPAADSPTTVADAGLTGEQ
jgi:hypothetical protein